MRAALLSGSERVVDTIVYVADYEHIAANATSANQVKIGTIPAGGAVVNAFAYEVVPFVGAPNITLDVGITVANPNNFIDAWDADSGTPAYNSGTGFTAGTASPIPGLSQPLFVSGTVDTPIIAEWNGSVSNLTAGKAVICVEVFNPGKFA